MLKNWFALALYAPADGTAGDVPAMDMNTTLSDAERAYISSRGTDMTAFSGDPEPPKEPPPAAAGAAPGEPAAEPEDDEADFEPAGNVQRDANGRFVKREAFLRVKGKAKAATEQVAQVSQRMETLEQRVGSLLQGGVDVPALIEALRKHEKAAPAAAAAPAAPAAPVAPPKPEEDIFAAFEHLSQTVQGMVQETQAQKQQREAIEAKQQMLSKFQQDAVQFVAKTPDFPAAYSHLAQTRARQLELMGLPPDQVQQRLQDEENQAVALAFQRGISPSQLLYDYAKTFGYTPAAPGAQPGGQAQAATADRKIAQINAGQRATASLTGGGTTPAPAAASGAELVQKLVAMEQKEFEAFRSKFIAEKGRETWRQQTGLG